MNFDFQFLPNATAPLPESLTEIHPPNPTENSFLNNMKLASSSLVTLVKTDSNNSYLSELIPDLNWQHFKDSAMDYGRAILNLDSNLEGIPDGTDLKKDLDLYRALEKHYIEKYSGKFADQIAEMMDGELQSKLVDKQMKIQQYWIDKFLGAPWAISFMTALDNNDPKVSQFQDKIKGTSDKILEKVHGLMGTKAKQRMTPEDVDKMLSDIKRRFVAKFMRDKWSQKLTTDSEISSNLKALMTTQNKDELKQDFVNKNLLKNVKDILKDNSNGMDIEKDVLKKYLGDKWAELQHVAKDRQAKELESMFESSPVILSTVIESKGQPAMGLHDYASNYAGMTGQGIMDRLRGYGVVPKKPLVIAPSISFATHQSSGLEQNQVTDPLKELSGYDSNMLNELLKSSGLADFLNRKRQEMSLFMSLQVALTDPETRIDDLIYKYTGEDNNYAQVLDVDDKLAGNYDDLTIGETDQSLSDYHKAKRNRWSTTEDLRAKGSQATDPEAQINDLIAKYAGPFADYIGGADKQGYNNSKVFDLIEKYAGNYDDLTIGETDQYLSDYHKAKRNRWSTTEDLSAKGSQATDPEAQINDLIAKYAGPFADYIGGADKQGYNNSKVFDIIEKYAGDYANLTIGEMDGSVADYYSNKEDNLKEQLSQIYKTYVKGFIGNSSSPRDQLKSMLNTYVGDFAEMIIDSIDKEMANTTTDTPFVAMAVDAPTSRHGLNNKKVFDFIGKWTDDFADFINWGTDRSDGEYNKGANSTRGSEIERFLDEIQLKDSQWQKYFGKYFPKINLAVRNDKEVAQTNLQVTPIENQVEFAQKFSGKYSQEVKKLLEDMDFSGFSIPLAFSVFVPGSLATDKAVTMMAREPDRVTYSKLDDLILVNSIYKVDDSAVPMVVSGLLPPEVVGSKDNTPLKHYRAIMEKYGFPSDQFKEVYGMWSNKYGDPNAWTTSSFLDNKISGLSHHVSEQGMEKETLQFVSFVKNDPLSIEWNGQTVEPQKQTFAESEIAERKKLYQRLGLPTNVEELNKLIDSWQNRFKINVDKFFKGSLKTSKKLI